MQDAAGLRTNRATEGATAAVAPHGDDHSVLEWGLKRTIDLMLALVLLMPLIFACVVAGSLIVLIDRQPPLYLDRRLGRQRKEFQCIKLRTLHRDEALLDRYLASHPEEADCYARSRKLRRDPRTTRLGVFLRRSSLDEAPQVINVLLGHMSMVGPRPVARAELGARTGAAAYLPLVRPGLAGLWQISGRSALPPSERDRLDAEYVNHWSIRLDLLILLRTPHAVFSGYGAQ
jgi:exopolysaccharide production protein ExoY